MKSAQNIDDLFEKFLNRNCTSDELRQLFEHFRTTDEDMLRQLIKAELIRPDSDIHTTEERQVRLANVHKNIKNHIARQETPSVKGFPFRKYITVAAALITFAFIGYYLYKSYNPVTEQEQQLTSIYGDDVAPGGNWATITLSDGTVIALDENQSGIVASGTELSYADGEKLLDAGKDVQFMTMATPRGGQYQITLPDGTKVWLNAASSLRYPDRFNSNERRVALEGEAYFEVARDESHPFIVESNGQSIEVLGTGFNVNAYGDEPQLLTTLAHGSIRIYTADESKSIILKPGEQAAVAGKNIKVKQVQVDEYTAWRNGKISLSQADLSGIIRQIERWYDVKFDIEYLPPSEAMFGVLKRDVQLSELLQALELHYNVKFTRNGRRITMSK